MAADERDCQAIKVLDPHAGQMGHRRPDEFDAFVECEQRVLVRIDADPHDHPWKDARGPLDDVEVPEGDRIERPRVDRRFGVWLPHGSRRDWPASRCFLGQWSGLCRFGRHERFSGLHTAGESAQKVIRAFTRNSAWTTLARKVLYGTEGGVVSGAGKASLMLPDRSGDDELLMGHGGGQAT